MIDICGDKVAFDRVTKMFALVDVNIFKGQAVIDSLSTIQAIKNIH